MNNLIDIADQFKPQGKVIDIQEFGNGNINSTFLVTLDSLEEKHFILQRINTQVFRQPKLVMQNMSVFTLHVRDKPKALSSAYRLQNNPQNRRWEVPRVLLTQNAQNHFIDADGSFWRAISFIEAAESFDTIKDSNHAREVGYALGMFHNLISDLPTEKLADTLPGFHITPRYLQQYVETRSVASLQSSVSQSAEVKYCLQFVSDRSSWAHVLENAQAQGQLIKRPIHGDPKVNNVMIDTTTGHGISIIDLDTVKPGLVHYDIGDCLRSSCNFLGEETDQWDMVRFDTDICQSVLQGYLSVARDFLTISDYEYMYDAIRLIAFELGLRFFTDYLAGNVYFKIKYPEHNLNRAIVQFKLTESIESQETAIRAIIQQMR
ncbi:aminoglycoside phosphotransferase family protein [Hassallia byssoidea VB512170]|uniref:Aminoglycoside phosphotransferase family protein n=1 Tax=Hassallia byssoidea VB512170 TaxID=1304833 RepID=A0A846HHA8_9CYAN|nr:aminoglycoside phosphotransferase family protein [Hassalia byssoidea]NEU76722.1 aminoglycoside phosphotransferase family protein [Hassalia byssoidea VB512170]